LEDHGLAYLRSDPAALRLIVRNGLENAVKYTHEGGEVTLRLSNESGGACIEIIDTGPGIPAEEIEKVFNAFHRVSASPEGSGLGLAIAREASEKIGAQLTLSNRPDQSGLVFLLKQPISM
jgi:two-component system OmpR family sensor kinase